MKAEFLFLSVLILISLTGCRHVEPWTAADASGIYTAGKVKSGKKQGYLTPYLELKTNEKNEMQLIIENEDGTSFTSPVVFNAQKGTIEPKRRNNEFYGPIKLFRDQKDGTVSLGHREGSFWRPHWRMYDKTASIGRAVGKPEQGGSWEITFENKTLDTPENQAFLIRYLDAQKFASYCIKFRFRRVEILSPDGVLIRALETPGTIAYHHVDPAKVDYSGTTSGDRIKFPSPNGIVVLYGYHPVRTFECKPAEKQPWYRGVLDFFRWKKTAEQKGTSEKSRKEKQAWYQGILDFCHIGKKTSDSGTDGSLPKSEDVKKQKNDKKTQK